jgi:hypothetical protein
MTTTTDQPVKIIFDTDFQTDCDDAGALAVLHALADNGEADILATFVSARNPWSVSAVDAVNTYYGRADIPIGALKGPGVDLPSPYTQTLAERFTHAATAANATDAVTLYREVLAAQDDASVTLMTVGYATNLRDLLASGSDRYSSLTGAELVARKVAKWVNMGGNFEVRSSPYAMNTTNVNWERDAEAAITAINDWPTEIVFVGREIGHSMRAGRRLDQTRADNPVRVAYEAQLGSTRDHHLADLSTVLYAVRGLAYGDDTYWAQEHGRIEMLDGAKFNWRVGAAGGRAESRVIDAYTDPTLGLMSPADIQKLIEDLMIQPPRRA